MCTDADPDANSEADADPDSNSDANSDADADTEADTDTDSDSDARAKACRVGPPRGLGDRDGGRGRGGAWSCDAFYRGDPVRGPEDPVRGG